MLCSQQDDNYAVLTETTPLSIFKQIGQIYDSQIFYAHQQAHNKCVVQNDISVRLKSCKY